MKYTFACALLAIVAAATPGQTKHSFSGKCGKAEVVQSIPAGDKDGHTFMLQQGKCESTGEVGGAKSKEGNFSEHDEATGTRLKGWEYTWRRLIVETRFSTTIKPVGQPKTA